MAQRAIYTPMLIMSRPLSVSIGRLGYKLMRMSTWNKTEQTVAITGGSRGIGLEIAKKLARESDPAIVKFLLISQHRGRLEGGKGEMEKAGYPGNSIYTFNADLANPDDVAATMKRISMSDPPVKVLINCAGISSTAPLVTSGIDIVSTTIRVNLESAILLSKAAIKKMMRHGGGSIINIASVNALSGTPGQSVYSATKAGLIGFTKSLCKETGRKNIRVNCIAPGLTSTDMTADLPSSIKDKYLERIALGRIGSPEDIAEAAIFLLNCKYINGQTIIVDGGMI